MTLSAGVARASLTPPADIPNGMWMAQQHIRAAGIHQDLWLTALALEGGDERVLVIDLDWCLLSTAQVDDLRRAVSAATSVAPMRILPFCTHNHAGPVTQDTYEGEGAAEVAAYVASLPSRAVEACREALERLEPARVAAGFGHSEIGVNRDLRLADQTVAGPNVDGPADRAVGVVRLERADGSPIAILVNYACHPTVLGPDNTLVSPDYPGTTKRVVEAQVGAPCLFLQGASGDMGPIEGFVADVRIAERLGTLLGLEAAKVALSLDARPVRRRLARVVASGAPLAVYVEEPTGEAEPALVVRSTTARLTVRDPLPDVFAEAEARLAGQLEHFADLQRSGAPAHELARTNQVIERERLRATRYHQYRASSAFEAEMHAVVLGEVALLCTWGEPYCRIGIEIKGGSPWPATLVCAYLGSEPLYVATPEAFVEPVPFQVDNCPFVPEAAAEMIAAALALLEAARAEVPR
jgi:hypothetical protein